MFSTVVSTYEKKGEPPVKFTEQNNMVQNEFWNTPYYFITYNFKNTNLILKNRFLNIPTYFKNTNLFTDTLSKA